MKKFKNFFLGGVESRYESNEMVITQHNDEEEILKGNSSLSLTKLSKLKRPSRKTDLNKIQVCLFEVVNDVLLNGEGVVYQAYDVYFYSQKQWIYGTIVLTEYRLLFFEVKEMTKLEKYSIHMSPRQHRSNGDLCQEESGKKSSGKKKAGKKIQKIFGKKKKKNNSTSSLEEEQRKMMMRENGSEVKKMERLITKIEGKLLVSAPLCSMDRIEKIGSKNVKDFSFQIYIRMKDVRELVFSFSATNSESRKVRDDIFNMICQDVLTEFCFAYQYRLKGDVVSRRVVYDVEKEFILRQQCVHGVTRDKFNEVKKEFCSNEKSFSNSNNIFEENSNSIMVPSLENILENYEEENYFNVDYGCHEYSRWRICDINKNNDKITTYPERFLVPYNIDDDFLLKCMEMRKKKRLPILCWCNPKTGVSLLRSAQPRTGINITEKSVKEFDLKYLHAVAENSEEKKDIEIIDLRPKLNAEANRLKGGGYEIGYDRCKVKMMDIQNIHVMRKAFKQLFLLCLSDKGIGQNFLSKVWDTKWYYHLKLCLRASLLMAKKLMFSGHCVLAHCSDGWDRTSQCVSLCQLLIDKYYRTMDGFCVLIQKEWLQIGHQFHTRMGIGCKGGFLTAEERSPIFLQFVECVSILIKQHPCAFEFNDNFLIELLDEAYSARFGNFLLNSQRQRRVSGVFEDSEDFFSYILSVESRKKFYNNLYDNKVKVIIPDLRESGIPFWKEYYLRYNKPDQNYIKEVTKDPLNKIHFYNNFEERSVIIDKLFAKRKEKIIKNSEKIRLIRMTNEKTVNLFQNELRDLNDTLKIEENENKKLKRMKKKLKAFLEKKKQVVWERK